MTFLRLRMIEDMKVRNLAAKTQRIYVSPSQEVACRQVIVRGLAPPCPSAKAATRASTATVEAGQPRRRDRDERPGQPVSQRQAADGAPHRISVAGLRCYTNRQQHLGDRVAVETEAGAAY